MKLSTALSCAAGVLISVGCPAQQLPSSSIGFAFPAGGGQGTTFEVKVGGQFLDGATNALVSGAGVRAVVTDYFKPLTPGQFNMLREQFKALQDQKAQAARNARKKRQGASSDSSEPGVTWTAQNEKNLNEIRRKLATFQRRPTTPAIAERVTLRVTVAADAPPGKRELRLQSRSGLSNPLVFCVGTLPEFTERNAEEVPQPLRQQRQAEAGAAVAPSEVSVTLPVTLNGTILQGGVDRYRFSARKGQHLVAVVSARDLVPYLADAVPGWFQATLTLYDSNGKELAYNDDFKFQPDPVLHFEVPRDGTYVVEIRDAIYRGRDDFVYRLSIGELPFVSGVFPLGCSAGTAGTFKVTGWNLVTNSVCTVQVSDTPGLHALPLQTGVPRPVIVSADNLPECFEQEPNSYPQNPQPVRLPVIVNGRIGDPGDVDAFSFDGKAGEDIVVEVNARRLDSPLDSLVRLTDSRGNQLAFNDDFEDQGAGLETHHADSYLRATLPTNGTYVAQLTDAQNKGGADSAYRLRISAPQPDFALRVVPSSINARPGVWTPVTVYALRRDGFSGPIRVGLKDAPPGFVLSGAVIPERQDMVKMTLAPPADARDQTASVAFEGRARINGREVVRAAVSADDRMQAFAYHHLVPAQEARVAIIGRIGPRAIARVIGDTPVKIPAGGTARVRIAGAGPGFMDRFELALEDAPEGLALAKVVAYPLGPELVIQADAAKAKPGTKGNLIVGMVAGRPAAAKTKKQANARRVTVGVLPAIPYEIIAPL